MDEPLALALGGLSHLEHHPAPQPPSPGGLELQGEGQHTAREIRTRFSLRLSQDSDFSNFVRAKAERS